MNFWIEVDFDASSGCRTTLQEDKNPSSHSSISNLCVPAKPSIMPECQVVLNDIFSSGDTEKFKTLKTNQDKTHSAPSRQPNDSIYLESLSKKEPIAWPPMKDSDKWSQLDDNVFCHLIGGSTVHDRVSLLESSIYSQASLLFGHLPPPKKGL